MYVYEDENIIVKPSHIEGLGVFAKRMFKNGETVLVWRPTKLTEKELITIPKDQKRYINKLELEYEVALKRFNERVTNAMLIPEKERKISNTSIDRFKELNDIYNREKNNLAITFRTDELDAEEISEEIIKLL